MGKIDKYDVKYFPFPELKLVGKHVTLELMITDPNVIVAWKTGSQGFKKTHYREWRTYKHERTGYRYRILIEISPLEYSNFRIESVHGKPALKFNISGFLRELDRMKLSESENEEFEARLKRGDTNAFTNKQKTTIFRPDGTQVN